MLKYFLYGCLSMTGIGTHCTALQPDGDWYSDPRPSRCVPYDLCEVLPQQGMPLPPMPPLRNFFPPSYPPVATAPRLRSAPPPAPPVEPETLPAPPPVLRPSRSYMQR